MRSCPSSMKASLADASHLFKTPIYLLVGMSHIAIDELYVAALITGSERRMQLGNWRACDVKKQRARCLE